MNRYLEIVKLIDAGTPFAVGLILSAEGSTPRNVGVRAVIDASGRISGTLGGGAVEFAAQHAAVDACKQGRASVIECDLAGPEAAGREPICGGHMRVLVDPTVRKDRDAFADAAAALDNRESGVLVTTVRSGVQVTTQVSWRPKASIAHADEAFPETAALRACLDGGQAACLRESQSGPGDEDRMVLVEPIVPDPLLVVVGGGHVGQALAVQASLVGFDVLVIDDRPEFTDPHLFPENAATQCGDIADALRAHPLGNDTYVVIVTRGHAHDAEALRACLGKPAAYVGMIGSRRKVAMVRESLIQDGAATAEEFDRVYAPIGLDIGAETVPEIAASIVAQLIAVRRQGTPDRSPRDMVGR